MDIVAGSIRNEPVREYSLTFSIGDSGGEAHVIQAGFDARDAIQIARELLGPNYKLKHASPYRSYGRLD